MEWDVYVTGDLRCAQLYNIYVPTICLFYIMKTY